MSATSLFLSGAIAMQYVVAALFFLRYRKMTGDRLFAFFAAAFALFAIERMVGAYVGPAKETAAYIYLIRLLAFLIILWAIMSKNRALNDEQ